MEAIKQKKSLVEETYDSLVEAICARGFLPGERLNQDEIAAKLNVSRQPVNSAMSILKADRLVVDTGRRGVVVADLDPGLLRSIYEYRLTVEPFAVRLAGARLPDNARQEAEQVLRHGRKAVRSDDIRALLRADKAFHDMIYRWGGNEIIEASMRVTWTHIRRSMAEVLGDPSRAGSTWDEHERIVTSLLAGDLDAAAEAMRIHLSNAYSRYFAPGPGTSEAS